MASFFEKIRNGLKKTATAIGRGFAGLFTDVKLWDDKAFAALERTLIDADFGVAASKKIVSGIRERYELGQLSGSSDIMRIAADTVTEMMKKDARPLRTNPDKGPAVYLFIGVNGSGKTTSIGKLANKLRKEGKTVMLAACDTFRAAAVEQLVLWAERTSSLIVSAKHGADPSSVAFDAVKSAMAKNVDYLLIDTAGRQQNSRALMDELAKLLRTIKKVMPSAPHETFLTVDASLGSNVLSQAREFASKAGASALILTKLDGTGKGGAACAVQTEFGLPVEFVGLGEAPDDLHDFSAEEYAEALFVSGPSGDEASSEN